MAEAKLKLISWSHEVAEFEQRFPGALNEPAKILALRTLVPRSITGNAFSGKDIRSFAELYDGISRMVTERTFQNADDTKANKTRDGVDAVAGTARSNDLEDRLDDQPGVGRVELELALVGLVGILEEVRNSTDEGDGP